MRKSEITKAYKILENYTGPNPWVKAMASQHKRQGKVLNEFEATYINTNHDYEPVEINKVFHITPELGEKLFEKYSLAFVPEKIKITKVIGEIKSSYHAYFQYRQSEPVRLAFISQRGIMGSLMKVDWKSLEFDFSSIEKMSEKRGKKITLKKHQEEGVKFMVGNKKCICADEMGAGKTITSLASSIYAGCKNVLIISPASLKTNWLRECSFFVDPKKIALVNGSKWDAKDKQFTIMNYEIVQNFYEVAEEPVFDTVEIKDADGKVVETIQKPVMVKNSKGEYVQKMKKSRKKEDIKKALENSPLFTSGFDCVIIDEAQKLSNKGSIRYKTIQDFLRKSAPKYIFLLTGTPLTNNPMNLYNILNLIDADIVKNYDYYIKRFCGAVKHKRKDGHEYITFGEFNNLDELREKIKDVYIRRLTSDIGDMVEKKVSRRYFNFTEEQEIKYNKLWNDYVKSQEGYQITFNDEYDDFWIDYNENNNLDKHRALVEGSLIRQFFGREMVEHTIEVANEIIEDGEKVVIMTIFRREMEMLKDYYKDKAVCYRGGMSIKQKDKAQEDFNNNPNIQVFLGQLIASGTGLSLPSASKIIFNNYDWVYANNVQGESRIHRLTQTKDVECIYMLFNNSVSEEMFNKVLYKGYLSDELIKNEKSKA